MEDTDSICCSDKIRVIIISGPTAVGKSFIAIKVANMLGGEIISADSVQVYKGMDIGTAKLTDGEKESVTHHLIDICDLTEHYTATKFYEHSSELCAEIHKRGRVPIIVGGSGFYINLLTNGPPEGPPPSMKIREKISAEIKKDGAYKWYKKLCDIDPQYGSTISKHDVNKIVRAIEIHTVSGKKVSDFKKHTQTKTNFDFRYWCVYLPREKLFNKIELRCKEMVANGLINEVKTLKQLGIQEHRSASKAVGYKQAIDFLDSPGSTKDMEEFIKQFNQASRKCAKKQMTMLRNQKFPKSKWINPLVLTMGAITDTIVFDYINSE